MEPSLIENNDHSIPGVGAKRKAPNSFQTFARKHYPILFQLEDIQAYRTSKAEVLSAAQMLVLKYALSPAKLEKATFLQLCQGFEILNKAERLDSQLSTENVSVKIGTMAISEGTPW